MEINSNFPNVLAGHPRPPSADIKSVKRGAGDENVTGV